jgi:hypothetical protein
MDSPPPIPDLRIAVELLLMTEVPVAADQEMPVEMEVHVAACEGLLACFSYVLLAVVDCCGPDILGM